MRTFNLFISHSWTYGDSYERLIALLKDRNYFAFQDYSVPKNDPIHVNGTDTQLYRAIYRKMAPCSAVLILAGVYATYSKWIGKEIEIAKRGFANPKPIIAIRPWGNEKISSLVKENADYIVGWNTESVVSAIRYLA